MLLLSSIVCLSSQHEATNNISYRILILPGPNRSSSNPQPTFDHPEPTIPPVFRKSSVKGMLLGLRFLAESQTDTQWAPWSHRDRRRPRDRLRRQGRQRRQ